MGVVSWFVVAIIALYLLWRLLKLVNFYFREYYVLWNIATGGRADRRTMSAKIRLHVYVCKTDLMDEVSVNELYSFLIKMMDSDVSIKEFHSVLLSYSYAVVCRERKDGSLRGIMLMGVDHNELNGAKYTLIRLGLCFFQNYYRGGPLLYYIVAYHIIKELLLHPFTPLYIIGKAFSYKSYMVICNTLSRCYPRCDLETTEFARSIINEYGKKAKSLNEVYDADKFVLRRERTAMKEGVAFLSVDDLKNPHIKFFVEQNPGWVKGHQLVVVGEARWSDLFRMVWRSLMRANRARKEEKQGPGVKTRKKRVLNRRYSFQNETARRYATVFSEVDFGGNHSNHVADGEGLVGVNEAEEMSERPRTFSYDIYQDL